MKPSLLHGLESRTNKFYLLAFIPILLIFFFSPFSAVIPFYGFLILLLKSQKLSAFKEAGFTQKISGIVIIIGSFFAYYGVVFIYREAAFYGPANYVAYLFGLFLIFFEFSTLKEVFAPLFLIVAATSSIFLSEWLRPYIAPFSDDVAHFTVGILRILGVKANIFYYDNAPVVTFPSASGQTVLGAFVYECIGVYSALVFSIILIVILFEDPSGLKTRVTYSIVGLLGTFALNIIRIVGIFITDYFYGIEAGGTIHYIIGYALFSTWLACFLYVYSKRRTLQTKITSLWKKNLDRTLKDDQGSISARL